MKGVRIQPRPKDSSVRGVFSSFVLPSTGRHHNHARVSFPRERLGIRLKRMGYSRSKYCDLGIVAKKGESLRHHTVADHYRFNKKELEISSPGGS